MLDIKVIIKNKNLFIQSLHLKMEFTMLPVGLVLIALIHQYQLNRFTGAWMPHKTNRVNNIIKLVQ